MTDYPLPDDSRLPRRQDILDRTHCDVCRRTHADGATLDWFSSATVVCERQTCLDRMLEGWNETCRQIEEEDRERRGGHGHPEDLY